MSHRQLNLPPVPVRSVDADTSTRCPVEVNPVDAIGKMLRDAQDAVLVQHKEAAISAGYSEDYWTRVLNGERGVYLERLRLLPESVQREFVKRWAWRLRLEVHEHDTQKQAALNLLRAATEFIAKVA